MTPFSLPKNDYLILQREKGSFIETTLMLKNSKLKPAVVQTYQTMLPGLTLEYDESDDSIEVAGLVVHPIYHDGVYPIGHVIFFTNKRTKVVIGYKNAGFSYKDAATSPSMKVTWQDVNLTILEDRRRGVALLLTPSEVKREDWN